MPRTEFKRCPRIQSFSIVLTATIAVAVLAGSCLFDTKSNLCETTGLHCWYDQVCAPQQGICVPRDGCGNGTLNKGEACDDGNLIDGDGCDSNCQRTGCGNGRVTDGEECDLGSMNSDTGACLPNCRNATCGDGKNHLGVEQCDDGELNSDTGSCLKDCQFARCGDGYIRSSIEQCDDGNNQECGTCSATCMSIAQPAKGSIYMVPAVLIQPGEGFDLGDGYMFRRFRYAVSEEVSDVLITLDDFDTGDQVAQKTADAINGSGLLIIANIENNFQRKVTLVNMEIGIAGNSTIMLINGLTSPPTQPFFVPIGMSGGTGYKCSTGVGCMSPDDCVSKMCIMHVCM